jgi:hypothetical protein
VHWGISADATLSDDEDVMASDGAISNVYFWQNSKGQKFVL